MKRSKSEIIKQLMEELEMSGDTVLEIENKTGKPIVCNVVKQSIGRYKLELLERQPDLLKPGMPLLVDNNSRISMEFDISQTASNEHYGEPFGNKEKLSKLIDRIP